MTQQPMVSYLLHLADNALIAGHRNSEWTGHGPILEQDIALSNISLDLIGQSRNLYQYAATIINESGDGKEPATEDSLAYLRDTRDFKNCLLVEQPKGHWGHTVLKQFFFSTYQFFLYRQLQQSEDSTIAAIAEKSYKEVAYHLRWSSEWVIRLGDGTEESHAKMQQAFDDLWRFTGELYTPAPYELKCFELKIGADLSAIKKSFLEKMESVLTIATLVNDRSSIYSNQPFMQTGGKEGKHTEHLGYLLAEMQFLQRAYPEAEW